MHRPSSDSAVARIERSEIRDHARRAALPVPGFAALNLGYSCLSAAINPCGIAKPDSHPNVFNELLAGLRKRGGKVCNLGVLALPRKPLRHAAVGELLAIGVRGVALHLGQGSVT